MRWWTSMVSPISNFGRSSRSPPSTSVRYLFFMAHVLSGLFARGIGPRGWAGPTPMFRLLAPPLGNRPVVAAEQDVRHRHAAELARPGVLRVLQPAGVVAVRLLDHTLGVTEDARHVADDRVDDHHRRHL